ncbi:MAG TPA: hypothetical protein VK963_01565 [Candidatus Saccharimonadales bacterium]|nr:hypothetical protein [Candidatus Saccharimonadales bacterium]
MKNPRPSQRVERLLDQYGGCVKGPGAIATVAQSLGPASQRARQLLIEMEAAGQLVLVWQNEQVLSGIFRSQLADQWDSSTQEDIKFGPAALDTISFMLGHEGWSIASFTVLSIRLGHRPIVASGRLENLKGQGVVTRQFRERRYTLNEGVWLRQFGTAEMMSHQP